MFRHAIFAAALLSAICAWAQEWQSIVREDVARGDLNQAYALVEQRLQTFPNDLDAQGWRARLLAWNKRWSEAEAGYRKVLESAPADIDIRCGLADVLVWQGKDAEALAVLEPARSSTPVNAAILNRRGRVLARMGRLREARAEFSEALRQDPNDSDARAGLHSLPDNPRHQLRIGVDTDTFNYTETASAQSLALISRWREVWTTNFAVATYQRFGTNAQRMTAQITRRIGKAGWVTAGAGVAHDEAVIPRHELAGEYGRTVFASRHGFVRGVELSLRHQSLWFQDVRVQTLASTETLYFPRNWSWSLTLVGARTSFPMSGAEWSPSGSTRLWFPIRGERLGGNLLFAVGTEDFAKTDQVGHFAARTFGGGLRWQLTRFQDIGGYVAHQDRSQRRSQATFGVSYGVRF